MTDKAISPPSSVPEEDARDLLARLYREIGISAVAAALEVTRFKSGAEREPAEPAAAAASGTSGKKGLAA